MNAWKSRPSCSSVMPMPVSETGNCTIGLIGFERRHQGEPAVLVNLLALLNMLRGLLELGPVGADGAEVFSKAEFEALPFF